MLALAFAFIPISLAPLITDLPDGADAALNGAGWAIWAVFTLELVTKTYLAPSRMAYVRSHWFDVVVVVLPFLRPLRVLRGARVLRAATGLRVIAALVRVGHSARALLAKNGLQYVLAIGFALILASATTVWLIERDSGGNITNFGDALWWAAATVTTVGYGDAFPVTPEGRGIAVFLMLLGISIFGLVTANIAAFLVRPADEHDGLTLRDLALQIDRIERRINDLVAAQASGQPPSDLVSGKDAEGAITPGAPTKSR